MTNAGRMESLRSTPESKLVLYPLVVRAGVGSDRGPGDPGASAQNGLGQRAGRVDGDSFERWAIARAEVCVVA
jgi:hypothetical protein